MCWRLFLKKNPTQMFSWEICVVFKNNFFDRTFPMAASVAYVEENTKLNLV